MCKVEYLQGGAVMRLLRLVRLFVIFLILSGGLTTLVIDQADAACCNPWSRPGCTSWWSFMVHGSLYRIDEEGTKFLIKDEEGFSREVIASKEVADAFRTEGIKKDYGFSILNKIGEDVVLIGFVPNSPDHGKPNWKTNAIIARYNKNFRNGAQKPTVHYNKITNASMTTR
jgi:hypothetical protein